jgi:hypothetical protein
MIYTSNYFNVWGKKNVVQIANGKPEGFNVADQFPQLYPKWVWVKAKLPWEKFSEKYNKLLDGLDVHEIAKRCEGKILVCYENLQKAHCHRELVLQWFVANGYECEELPQKPSKTKVAVKKKKPSVKDVLLSLF